VVTFLKTKPPAIRYEGTDAGGVFSGWLLADDLHKPLAAGVQIEC